MDVEFLDVRNLSTGDSLSMDPYEEVTVAADGTCTADRLIFGGGGRIQAGASVTINVKPREPLNRSEEITQSSELSVPSNHKKRKKRLYPKAVILKVAKSCG